MPFTDRVAVITGAARGIGFAYAQALAARGAAVAIADIDIDAATAAAAALAREGGRILAVGCDVAEQASVENAFARIAATFGGIDILINNAAKHLSEFDVPLTALPRHKWRQLLDVNVIGIVNCSAACRSSMRQRGGGVIVNQGSIAGRVPSTPYGISKLAVQGLTIGLAQELAPDGIRVCCIAPGLVDSPAALADVSDALRDKLVNQLQLIKRPGRMADLVNAMLFFCSDEASFVTGETLFVGGGFPLRV
jgi:3-oxoacyl-[acyl-carrier protein] reductase